MSDAAAAGQKLPVGGRGRASLGWLGMLCVIATEAALFAYLLFDYFYYALQLGGNWPPGRRPSVGFSLPAVLLLIASSVAVWWGERGARQDRRAALLGGLALALALGVAFALLQLLDWRGEPITLRSGEYGSMFFTLTGLHLAHLAAGLLLLLVLLLWSALGYFDATRNAPVLIGAAYWHFVVAVGIAVFVTLYVTPWLW